MPAFTFVFVFIALSPFTFYIRKPVQKWLTIFATFLGRFHGLLVQREKSCYPGRKSIVIIIRLPMGAGLLRIMGFAG